VQRQGQPLPTFVDDAFDPGDAVLLIDDVVDSIDLGGAGNAPARGPLRVIRRDARRGSGGVVAAPM